MRREVKPPVREPQAVEDHGLHGLPDTDVTLLFVLRDERIDPFGDAKLINHARYQPEVLDRLRFVPGTRHDSA